MRFPARPGEDTRVRMKIPARVVWQRALSGLAVSAVGGALCAYIGTPLPWMIGSLLAMAICNFSGASLVAPRFSRECGQFVIAMTLGLYFTPSVFSLVLTHWWVLLGAAAGAIAMGHLTGLFLSRAGGVDASTAFFASIPGGAMEMARLSERWGAAVDKVAISHALRLLLVVCIFPVAMTLAGAHGSDTYHPVLIPLDGLKLAELAAITSLGGILFQAAGFPNPWMMGPLIATIALTACGIEFSSMPRGLANAAQVALGCSLGSRFTRRSLTGAPRFVAAVLASLALIMLLSVLFGWALAWVSGLSVASVILACAPGGIAEMSITARTLQLGVALVTAAHVTRVLVILVSADSVHRLLFPAQPRQR